MRGGFDVLADLAGALDDAGNEIDPVLREVLAAGPFGIGVNAVGMLQRLLSSTQPESGTTSYQYDADSNLTWRKDARGEQTCYQYDSLNRVQKKVYYSGSIPDAQGGNCDAVPASSFLLPTVA